MTTISNDWRMIPLAEAIADFLAEHAAEGTQTHRSYVAALGQLADFVAESSKIKSPTLEQLTRGRVEAFVEKLFSDGKMPATVAHRIDVFKSASKWFAIRYPGYLDQLKSLRRPTIVNAGKRAFKPGDVDKLRSVIRAHAVAFLAARNALIFELAMRAGLRCSEICWLRANNISDNMLVNVRRKGRKFFTLPMHSRIEEALAAYLPLREAMLRAQAGRELSEEEAAKAPLLLRYVLQPCEISHLEAKTVRRLFADAGKKVGLKKCHPHMAKHSFTNDVLRNADLPTASRAAGHSNLSTTMAYLGRDLEDLEAAIKNLD